MRYIVTTPRILGVQKYREQKFGGKCRASKISTIHVHQLPAARIAWHMRCTDCTGDLRYAKLHVYIYIYVCLVGFFV